MNTQPKTYATTTDKSGRAYRVIRWDGEYVCQQHDHDETWAMGYGFKTVAAARKAMADWAEHTA